MNARILVLLVVLASSTWSSIAFSDNVYHAGRVDFRVQVNDLQSDYSVLAQFVMPGEEVIFKSESKLTAYARHGYLVDAKKAWHWKAPVKPGLYPIELQHAGQKMTLNMFVMRPASEMKNGYLGKYQIGKYQRQPFKGLAVYQAPKGFIEVTPENQDTLVSPHFTLKQFLCKQQPSTWPKYMVLRPQLLFKLEDILEQVNEAGIRANAFVVMSGYRTPWYNRSIGNRTSSSRHLYGGAADFYIDIQPIDDVMDDLNKDGKLNKGDANYLYELIDKWSHESWWSRHTGGLASYGANSAHGPFVHVDARGYKARWGR